MFQSSFAPREFSLAVVGLRFPNRDAARSCRSTEAKRCCPGDPVRLVPDRNNIVDPYAVAVWSDRNIQIGYVTAERASYIRTLIAHGYQAIFQELGATSAIIRARFGGGTPTLPAIGDPDRADVDCRPDWGC